MLQKSSKYGTVLTVGPRLKKFIAAGYGDGLLWGENYPDQEEPTQNGRGEFQKTREWIERARLEQLFDLWCRGHNLIGYAQTMLRAVPIFRRIAGKRKEAECKTASTS